MAELLGIKIEHVRIPQSEIPMYKNLCSSSALSTAHHDLTGILSVQRDPTHFDPERNVGVHLQDYTASKPNGQEIAMYSDSDTRTQAPCSRTCLYRHNRDESPVALGVSHCGTAVVLGAADTRVLLTGTGKPCFHLKHVSHRLYQVF